MELMLLFVSIEKHLKRSTFYICQSTTHLRSFSECRTDFEQYVALMNNLFLQLLYIFNQFRPSETIFFPRIRHFMFFCRKRRLNLLEMFHLLKRQWIQFGNMNIRLKMSRNTFHFKALKVTAYKMDTRERVFQRKYFEQMFKVSKDQKALGWFFHQFKAVCMFALKGKYVFSEDFCCCC